MPDLSDLIKKREKSKFIKRSFRPWDLSGNDSDTVHPIEKSETVNKPLTNCNQIVIETVNKVETNDKQTVNKVHLIEESVNKTVSTTVNKIINKPLTNRKQSVINYPFSSLIGLQRAILLFIYECSKSTRGQITDAITLEHIAAHLETTMKTVKTTIQRLVDKGCLTRVESKNGRGGWSRYSLSESIYQDILQSETVNKVETNRKQSVSTTINTTVNSPSSSSSLNINKTTTTEIPEEWEFDIKPYAEFGFTKVQVKQLVQLNLSPSDVEDSLIHFAYDNANSYLPKILTTKINFLMGLLRRGQKYVSEKYFSEQEALLQEMAQREQARKRKLEEDRFTVWLANLNDDDEKLLLKPMPANLISAFHTYKNHNRLDRTLKDWMMGYFLSCST